METAVSDHGYLPRHLKVPGVAQASSLSQHPTTARMAVLPWSNTGFQPVPKTSATARMAVLPQDSTPQFFNPFEELDASERYLPHWYQSGALYFITFRLADSLPQHKLDQLKQERGAWLDKQSQPLTPEAQKEYHRLFSDKIEEWLDAGSGSCCLKEPENAEILANAMKHFDGERYQLGDWVVMPNHVHVVVAPTKPHTLSEILHSWKSYTANQINKRDGKSGKLWQEESYDHLIRNVRELHRINEYIRRNPEKAKVTALSGSTGFQT